MSWRWWFVALSLSLSLWTVVVVALSPDNATFASILGQEVLKIEEQSLIEETEEEEDKEEKWEEEDENEKAAGPNHEECVGCHCLATTVPRWTCDVCPKLDVLIQSVGGVGSSNVFHNLQRGQVQTNDVDDKDYAKHRARPVLLPKGFDTYQHTAMFNQMCRKEYPNFPPGPIPFRSIFVYGPPIHSLASLFRRGYQSQIFKSNGYVSHSGTCELYDSLEVYAQSGGLVDDMRLKRNFLSHLTEPAEFERIFIRGSVQDVYLETVKSMLCDPNPIDPLDPRLPQTSYASMLQNKGFTLFTGNADTRKLIEGLTESSRAALEAMYGGLTNLMDAMPPMMVIPAREGSNVHLY
eukprot:TRINITY_DN4449_c1_g1_i2.p1 TRINITY_DN4449_c1_g1~~TRINITY_DN4449_c1_g1_i2.p1  ORF type:complete len:351 (-),score=38.63 TRINITY_DN4449_c1_g1_i2:447-1499(-)